MYINPSFNIHAVHDYDKVMMILVSDHDFISVESQKGDIAIDLVQR